MLRKITLLTIFSTAGWAQFKTYVATTGSDAANCSLSTPCATWNQAIFMAGANGVVLALDSGDFGTINTTKPVVVDGGQHGALVSPGGSISTLIVSISLGSNALNPVVLRNLVIAVPLAGATGIQANLTTGGLILDHVAIEAGPTSGTTAVSVNVGQNASVRLKDVTITGPGRGAYISGGTDTVFDHVSITAVNSGIVGLDASFTVRDSSIQGLAAASQGPLANCLEVDATTTSPVVLFENSHASGCSIGASVNAGTVKLSNDVFSGNLTGVSVTSPGVAISYRNNTFSGNGTDGSPLLSTSLK